MNISPFIGAEQKLTLFSKTFQYLVLICLVLYVTVPGSLQFYAYLTDTSTNDTYTDPFFNQYVIITIIIVYSKNFQFNLIFYFSAIFLTHLTLRSIRYVTFWVHSVPLHWLLLFQLLICNSVDFAFFQQHYTITLKLVLMKLINILLRTLKPNAKIE